MYEFRCYASQEHEKFRLVRLLLSLGLDNIARNLCIQIVPKSSPKPPEEKAEKKLEPDPISHAQLECKRCFKQFPSQDLLKFFMHEKKCSSKSDSTAPVPQIPPGITPLKDIEKVNLRKTSKVRTFLWLKFLLSFPRSPKHVQCAAGRLQDRVLAGSILSMLISRGNTSRSNSAKIIW